jgi:hypothetical protein
MEMEMDGEARSDGMEKRTMKNKTSKRCRERN